MYKSDSYISKPTTSLSLEPENNGQNQAELTTGSRSREGSELSSASLSARTPVPTDLCSQSSSEKSENISTTFKEFTGLSNYQTHPSVTHSCPIPVLPASVEAVKDKTKVLQFKSYVENQGTFGFPKSQKQLNNIDTNSLIMLRNCTKTLLRILELIQVKTQGKNLPEKDATSLTNVFGAIPYQLTKYEEECLPLVQRKLVYQAKRLSSNDFPDRADCTVYTHLIRKCACLKREFYNDFTIHFNESPKYYTSQLGELIKNIRILKKFLYMGGDYMKHALMFLNEGLTDSAPAEKLEITQGCTLADICNVFDEPSIIYQCITWSCNNEQFRDRATENFAAIFLLKLVQLEEGRRYLKFSMKITNEITKLIRKKGLVLTFDTIDTLHEMLNVLQPPLSRQFAVSRYCYKPTDEGMAQKILMSLTYYRSELTYPEILTHLDMIHDMSKSDTRKPEIMQHFPELIKLLKEIIKEQDNAELNVLVATLLNYLITPNEKLNKKTIHLSVKLPKAMVLAHVATEPIGMKCEKCQIPIRKKYITAKKTKPKSNAKSQEMKSKSKATAYSEPMLNKMRSTSNQNLKTPVKTIPQKKQDGSDISDPYDPNYDPHGHSMSILRNEFN